MTKLSYSLRTCDFRSWCYKMRNAFSRKSFPTWLESKCVFEVTCNILHMIASEMHALTIELHGSELNKSR